MQTSDQCGRTCCIAYFRNFLRVTTLKYLLTTDLIATFGGSLLSNVFCDALDNIALQQRGH